MRRNISESLATINLKDLLSDKEINDLIKYSEFKSCKERDYIYEKDELCYKLISIVIDKFKEMKESSLLKCLLWMQKQLQIFLHIKPDSYNYKNLEKMKKTEPSLKMKLGWMEQYSNLNQEEELYKVVRRKFKSKTIIKKPENEKNYAMKRKSLNTDLNSMNEGTIMNMDKLNDNLLDFKSPNFDIFKLEKKVGRDNILPVTTTYVFISLNLFSIIDYTKFEPFIFATANGYHRENPYHTDLHAADMVQTILLYTIYGNLQKLLDLNEIDLVSIFIAASIHDLGHPGYTNNYLINTKNDLAIRYNDQSVLENYHVSEGFNIMFKKKNCNILESLPNDDYKICRKRIIQCVLATDMTQHNKQFQFLKLKIKTFGIKNGENFEKIFEGLDPIISYNLKQEFLNVIIHSADVSNPTKPLNIYTQWAKRCVDEFFKQGDMEKKLGLPVSFNCDRETVLLSQSQLGFIDAIVFPLFTALVECFENLNFTIDNLKKNEEYYKGVKEKDEKDKEKIIKEEKEDDNEEKSDD